MGSHTLTLPWSGASLGPTPLWLQAAAATVEFFGGFALIFGVLTRLASLLLCIDMIVASSHRSGVDLDRCSAHLRAETQRICE